jgi:FtsP/CotA-like multicopper oxidase with cupredoxin domain
LVYGATPAADQAQPVFIADALDPITPQEATHTWVLAGGMGGGGGGGMGGGGGGMENMAFTIDGETYPNVPVVTARFGSNTFIIKNDSSMAHPFHIHGERFQVVEADYLSWKDTFIVPANEQITVVSEFHNPGDWMYHCHILEHEEAGMMGILTIEP